MACCVPLHQSGHALMPWLCLVQLQVWAKSQSFKRESWSRSEGGVGRENGHFIQLTHELIHPLYQGPL